MEFAIKEIAKAKGIPLKDLAKRMGISPTVLSQNLAGSMSLTRLQEYADALDVSVKDLIKDDNDSITCPNCGKRFKME